MTRTLRSLATAVAVLAATACAPDDDQVEIREVQEVQTPAPVMPEDTVLLHDTVMPPGDTAHDDHEPEPDDAEARP